jgi:hypothetical protein
MNPAIKRLVDQAIRKLRREVTRLVRRANKPRRGQGRREGRASPGRVWVGVVKRLHSRQVRPVRE